MSKEANQRIHKHIALPSLSIRVKAPEQQHKPMEPNVLWPIRYNFRKQNNNSNHLTSSTSDLNAFLNRNSINSLLLEYSIETVTDSTGNFSEENCLGLGSFGKVYKGSLYGTLIAVKVLYSPKKQDFMQEVSALSKYRHPNLVMLMGYAIHQNTFYLIFEHISKGDLRARLTQGDLNWNERVSIMLDTATGLSYLHNSEPRCFHRDVKSSNILISEPGTAKVADFGLARLASTSQNFLKVKESAGTIGYADPHYVKTRTFSEASEVYSFGMLLFEILTSRPPAERKADGKIVFLINYIDGKLMNILNILDSNANFPESVAIDISNLALRCTSDNPNDRPNFLNIINDLKNLLSPSYVSDSYQSVESKFSELENFPEKLNATDRIPEVKLESKYLVDLNYELNPEENLNRIYQRDHNINLDTYNRNQRYEETSLTQITQFRNPDGIYSPITVSLNESVRVESYMNTQDISPEIHNAESITNISENIGLPIWQDVNAHPEFRHPTEQDIPLQINDNEDEYDRMMYELSIQMSIESEEARKIKEIEDQRELQFALEASKRDF